MTMAGPMFGDDDLAMPAWWRKGKNPTDWNRVCYATKTAALRTFYHHNIYVIDPWGGGGLEKTGSRGEFDSVNEKYGLRGKRRVTTIGRALWEAMPPHPPYCLDAMDLDALNETAPGREFGPFTLPDAAAYHQVMKKYQTQYEGARVRREMPLGAMAALGAAIAGIALGTAIAVART